MFHLAVSAWVAPPSTAPYEACRVAIQTYGVEQGLPNPRVHAVLLDRRNQLWVGTQEGLARLGSTGWSLLPLPAEARSTHIRALAEGADGALWVGTQEGGLWRHHRGTWKAFGDPERRINALLTTREGGREVLWVATAGAGLQRVDGETLSPVPGVRDPSIWCLALVPLGDGRTELWVGGEQALYAGRDGTWTRLDPGLPAWKGGANALAVTRTPQGTSEVLVSGWQVGLGRWNPDTRTFLGMDRTFPSRNPTSLMVARDPQGHEEVCAGTYDLGIQRRTPTGWQTLGPAQGLPSSCIYTLLPAPGGRPLLWAGTRDAGLVSVDPAGWRSMGPSGRAAERNAFCFLEAQGAFWMGTDQGLVRWTRSGPRTEGIAEGLPSPAVFTLACLPGPGGGELWAGTLNGLARRTAGRWQAVGIAQGVPLGRIHVLSVDQDPHGQPRLWAGAENGLGCLEAGRWRIFTPKDGLPSPMVYALLSTQDRDGGRSVWVGTRGGGLSRLKEGRWTHFGADQALPGKSIYSLAESRSPDGRRWLWVGLVGGRGLARLHLDRPDLGLETWPSLMAQLPSSTFHRVEVVGNRHLILTSPQGVLRIALEGAAGQPGEVTSYHTEDGLPSAASNPGATFQDSAGRIWVGTARGAAVMNLTPPSPLPAPSRPFVDHIQVEGRPHPIDQPLLMSHRDHTVTFTWILPVYQNREDVRYRTQLLGLEAVPGPWSQAPQREFTTLPPRDYVLRIWARDSHGRICGPIDHPFTVKPAPWATPWARILGALGLMGLGALVIRLRTRLLHRRAEALATLVAERTQALEEANQALRQQSLTDPLTGLGNRRYLETTIQENLARVQRHRLDPANHGHDLVLILMDLDHFKQINDRHGHAAGDQVLQQAAALLRSTVRPMDRVVRWGGEEFLLVASDMDVQEAPQLAERIRRLISDHRFDIAGPEPLAVCASLGFASIPLVGGRLETFTWEQVLSLADQCLYEAKAQGRNGWVGLLPEPDAPGITGHLPVDASALLASGMVRRVSSLQHD